MRKLSVLLGHIGLCVALSSCGTPEAARFERFAASEQQLTEAVAVLHATTSFATARVGRGAVPTPAAKAFAVILADQHAAEIFRRLIDEKSVACRLYALCGLWLTDRAAYASAEATVEKEPDLVTYQYGCVISQALPREIVSQDISSGRLPLDLQAFVAGQ